MCTGIPGEVTIMKLARLAVLAALALALGAGGCSKSGPTTPLSDRLIPRNPGNPTPGDTTPVVPPVVPPGPPARTPPPAVFLGADSTLVGTTGLSHWRLGNDGATPFTMHWSLASEAGWPGFPVQGSVTLRPGATAPLDVPVAVPASATDGFYTLMMTVDDPAGGTYSQAGAMRVHGNPGGPPPPVIQPVVYLSYADTVAAGGTEDTRWLMGNDGTAPFTMHWTLTSDAGWPGFPLEGDVALDPLSTKVVVIPVAVPTGTAPGMYGLTITVTRPGGLEYTGEGVVRVHG